MATTGNLSPIKQALVRTLRSNPDLKSVLTGDIHEGFAPAKTRPPYLTYQVHYAPLDYFWGSVVTEVGFDIFVWHENSVEADNLDALVFTTLQDAELKIDEQSTLICRRVSSMSLPDLNEEGKKMYQVGGIWEVWTDQLLPSKIAGSFSADATIT